MHIAYMAQWEENGEIDKCWIDMLQNTKISLLFLDAIVFINLFKKLYIYEKM